MKGGIDIMKPCAVVHTWIDMAKTEELHRPVWRASVCVYVSIDAARNAMKSEFADYLKDNYENIIAADYHYDCAYLEYAEGCKEIWSLTSDVVNSPLIEDN